MRLFFILLSALAIGLALTLRQAQTGLGVLDFQYPVEAEASIPSIHPQAVSNPDFVTAEELRGSELLGVDSTQGLERSVMEAENPDDPSTWERHGSLALNENVGEPLDPDDPSTWPQSDSTEVINIGEPMDPDDPASWPQSEGTEVINIGEPMDPDDPSTWPQSGSTEVINIGEPMDPDDPSTWPQ